MKSRISIKVDFNNQNNPHIRIDEADSDDVRDQLVSHFRQMFGHTSSWAKVEFGKFDGAGNSIWFIRPIPPHELEEQVKEMNSIVGILPKAQPILKEIDIINHVEEMCAASIEPKLFKQWDLIKEQLQKNRGIGKYYNTTQ